MSALDKLFLQWSERTPDWQTVAGEECTLEQVTLCAVVVQEVVQQNVLQKTRCTRQGGGERSHWAQWKNDEKDFVK